MLIHIKQLFAQGDFNLTSHQLDEVTGNVKMTVTITGKGGVTQQQGMFSLYAYPTVRQHTPNTQARGGEYPGSRRRDAESQNLSPAKWQA